MRRWYWPLIGIGTIVLLGQGLIVPYWGDDYVMLLAAEQARLAGDPWWSQFWPAEPDKFWRPLGEDVFWRAVEGQLGADVRLAHGVNLALLLAASAAVGWLVTGLINVKWPEINARQAGLAAGFLYAIHAAHFLPLVWVAASNSSIVVLFSAITIGAWVRGYGRTRGHGWLTLSASMFALALFSKEIAVVIPSLLAIVSLWLWPQRAPQRSTWVCAGMIAALTGVWLVARQAVVIPAGQAYALELGPNLLRNTASLGAFALNVPREALRFGITEGQYWALAWGAVCGLLQLAAMALLLGAALRRLGARGLLTLMAFFVVACGPYFFFGHNSYAYYVALGLIAYAVLAGLACVDLAKFRLATGLAVCSALLATGVSQLLPYPGLIGKARWGDAHLASLQSAAQESAAAFELPLRALIEDEQRYYAIGLAGLRYRLGLTQEQVLSASSCEQISGETILRLPADGPYQFEVCP